jgi:uncharacterized membrane protein YtjA (UPF0391 family)
LLPQTTTIGSDIVTQVGFDLPCRFNYCSRFGFTGISAASADIARILFFVFVVIFIVPLVLGAACQECILVRHDCFASGGSL